MFKIAVQRGHLYTKTTFTGTAGEQETVKKVSEEIRRIINEFGDSRIVLTLLDSNLSGVRGDFDVFVALHCDGSDNKDAHGFSVGYPKASVTSGKLAKALADNYKKFGRRFIGFNYTSAESGYYGFGEVSAKAHSLLELGFLSNPDERAFIQGHITEIAQNIVETLLTWFGLKSVPTPQPAPKPIPAPVEEDKPPVKVTYKKKSVELKPEDLIMKKGTLFVGLRKVLEGMGFTVDAKTSKGVLTIKVE